MALRSNCRTSWSRRSVSDTTSHPPLLPLESRGARETDREQKLESGLAALCRLTKGKGLGGHHHLLHTRHISKELARICCVLHFGGDCVASCEGHRWKRLGHGAEAEGGTNRTLKAFFSRGLRLVAPLLGLRSPTPPLCFPLRNICNSVSAYLLETLAQLTQCMLMCIVFDFNKKELKTCHNSTARAPASYN